MPSDDWERDAHSHRGSAVRQARIALGYTNRENFAAACNVSVRVLSDLESAARSNFSDRVLARVEQGLQWPAGTIEQITADPDFTPPAPMPGGDLIFRPPAFDRRPVLVDVSSVERAIAALTETSRSKAAGEQVDALGGALVTLCWPYVLRLVENNCQPGNELHPAVRPLYEAFTALSSEFSPSHPSQRYAQWLAGDSPAVASSVRQRYMHRWTESRRAPRGRHAGSEAEGGH